MHIPDGFLNAATIATTYVISTGGIANAVRVANKKLGEKHVPMMGILAAFVFTAQMLNFPVAGGTSGHFLGAALVAILLGPWAAVLIMSVVLIGQCLIFQDGGLLALGANIFNMGIVAGFGSYYIFRLMNTMYGKKATDESRVIESKRLLIPVFILVAAIFILGLFPDIVLQLIHPASQQLSSLIPSI